MTNWNKVPRDQCEAAARAGDPDAQSAVDLHHSLDRIMADMFKIRLSVQRLEKIADELIVVNRTAQ